MTEEQRCPLCEDVCSHLPPLPPGMPERSPFGEFHDAAPDAAEEAGSPRRARRRGSDRMRRPETHERGGEDR